MNRLFVTKRMQGFLKYLTVILPTLALLLFFYAAREDVLLVDIGCGGTGISTGSAAG
jgi:hypothetical protein